MYVCMYVCMYISTYFIYILHTHTHTHTHTHMIYTHILTYAHACVHTQMYECLSVFKRKLKTYVKNRSKNYHQHLVIILTL